DRADDDRRTRVVASEEARSHHLDEDEGGQPGGISGKRRRRGGGIRRREPAVLEQHRQDRQRPDRERDRRRKGQKQRQLQSAIERVVGRPGIAGADLSRHGRQDRGADRDPDDRQRQLVQTVGIIEERHRTGRQQRRDRGRNEKIDIGDAGAEHARYHDAEKPPKLGRQARQRRR